MWPATATGVMHWKSCGKFTDPELSVKSGKKNYRKEAGYMDNYMGRCEYCGKEMGIMAESQEEANHIVAKECFCGRD